MPELPGEQCTEAEILEANAQAIKLGKLESGVPAGIQKLGKPMSEFEAMARRYNMVDSAGKVRLGKSRISLKDVEKLREQRLKKAQPGKPWSSAQIKFSVTDEHGHHKISEIYPL